jgi:hypothetical protein
MAAMSFRALASQPVIFCHFYRFPASNFKDHLKDIEFLKFPIPFSESFVSIRFLQFCCKQNCGSPEIQATGGGIFVTSCKPKVKRASQDLSYVMEHDDGLIGIQKWTNGFV